MSRRPPTYMEQLQELRRRVDDKIRAEALRLRRLGLRHDEEHHQMLMALPAAEVRAWARQHGWDVGIRGPISIDARQAYYEAHQERRA